MMAPDAESTVVWIAFYGEHEQRDAFAAFTSEALAREHSDDVESLNVYNRPCRTIKRFQRWLRYQDGVWSNEHEPRVDDWPEWLGPGWDLPVERSDVLHYPVVPNNPYTWVIVEGASEAAVDAEIEARKRQVEANPTGPWPNDISSA